MRDQSIPRIQLHPHTLRVLTLLAAQVVLILLMPLEIGGWIPLRTVLSSFVIFSAINLAATSRRALIVGLALGVPAFIGRWLFNVYAVQVFLLLSNVFAICLFAFVFSLMLRAIVQGRIVTVETILLSVSSYIMLGFMWVMFYSLTVMLAPPGTSTFNFDPQLTADQAMAQLYYFSFVTLTTLGYGDILPLGPLARSLAMLEAITGPLFLAVLIAYLVGKYASHEEDAREAPRYVKLRKPPDQ